MNIANVVSRVRRSLAFGSAVGAQSPRRPIVMIQSDDWGRVGIPSVETIERLRNHYANIGESKWDFYGLETEGDIVALGEMLTTVKDLDGNSPCVTANFVMANADLPRMRDERYREFRWIPITRGFPDPWKEDLVPLYRSYIDKGVLEPGLHGFTHFNASEMVACLNEDSERGQRARLLAECEVPYLASFTPEYNFALISRRDGERFVGRRVQEAWVRSGVELFVEAFGKQPHTTCAPGYRADATTKSIWRAHCIESCQSVGLLPLKTSDGLVQLSRNVSFEPVLSEDDVISVALREAQRAVLFGTPIVICTHSINYVTRFVGAAERSRELLRQLLLSLLERFPDLRFASAAEVTRAWRENRADWFWDPSAEQRARRMQGPSVRSESQPV